MDDKLLARFRDGDPTAATAVRNHLRSVAARVIAAPQWERQGPADHRLEVAAAAEAMGGKAATPVQLAADAMAAAARGSLAELRSREVLVGADHLNVALVVELAMERASANQAAHARPHLEDCAACRRQVELVRHALRAAATASHLPTEPADLALDGLAAASQAAAEAAAELDAQEAGGRPTAPSPARPKRPRSRPPQRQPRDLSALRPILLILALLGAGLWWTQRLTPEERAWQAAALLPPEWPPLGRAGQYDGDVRDALVRMAEDGECRLAANTLHKAWLEDGEDIWLRWYEGLAHVCLRDGPRAVAALQEVERGAAEPPFGMDWWLGQALLLDGQRDEALRRLDRLAHSEHPRAAQAEALAGAARALP